MSKFKTLTHVLAGIAIVVVGWLATPAGMALVHQYPWLASVTLGAGILGLYRNPVK